MLLRCANKRQEMTRKLSHFFCRHQALLTLTVRNGSGTMASLQQLSVFLVHCLNVGFSLRLNWESAFLIRI